MEKRQKRRVWLVVAAALLALAALLMVAGQGEMPEVEALKVDFPRRMRTAERERAERRRTHVMPVAEVSDSGAPAERPRPKDPVLAALPRGKGKTAVVIEANALRHSPVGELLLDCMMRDGGKQLQEFREKSGVDPLKDLDRLVITDEGLMLSGDFSNARFKDLMKDGVSSNYGENARVYEPSETTQGANGTTVKRREPSAIGTWNNQLIVMGRSPDDVKATIDRVEGRGPDEPPAISENSTYGEMYGVLSVDMISRLFPPEQAALAQRLRNVAQNVELHLDATSDVALVADIQGANADEVTDLGKSLGAAMSLARIQAQAQGEKELAQLLDFAKVKPDGSSFTLEMAVPLSVIKERLAFCREERRAAPEPSAEEESAKAGVESTPPVAP
ncbi:hypothetical protein MYSTI_03820 [Myxococcus stipitatus DSM 14675]|uniref:Uncharacterized protein n=1 Tax=Myxococcus stipitatus (strain DSM 14675 / JCM 12634 / Mx s8) TaxID=1278073 RepID=L7U887_MYXSD|nr:hypothetical protein [Myxococcus stipitatus]AGC45126.1 hypothetical protein MYSTI_03820 [Myxococcus stipitatus DSM 14675]